MSDPRDSDGRMQAGRVEARRRRGRGAALNPAIRYERLARERTDDGWAVEDELPPLRTQVMVERSRSVLVRNSSPDLPFDRSINPYRGCEHGCIYCYARPSHARVGFSPGLDFETRLVAKPQAPRILADTLRRPSYRVAPVALGTNTDPYQPIEKEWRITRGLLEVLHEHRHPVAITTKGTLILRDLDLLGEMARMGIASVQVSLTTLDPKLSRAMEPRAASPGRRLMMIERLAAAGVPVGVSIAPLIPALNDHEIERLVAAAAAAGASWAGHIVLRLPLEVAPLFRDWLERVFPDRAARVMRAVHELHGGRDYDPAFGRRMKGRGVRAELIARRMHLARRRHGLAPGAPSLRCDLFHPPPRAGDQLDLFA